MPASRISHEEAQDIKVSLTWIRSYIRQAKGETVICADADPLDTILTICDRIDSKVDELRGAAK